jgi:hypothetical protein
VRRKKLTDENAVFVRRSMGMRGQPPVGAQLIALNK